MLSENTAQLVEHIVTLAAPERVHIKGVSGSVTARRLLAIRPRHRREGGSEAGLLGRQREMAVIEALQDRAIAGHGVVASVVGSAGIGKSRLVREAAELASSRGMEVFWAFCESHAKAIPFGVVTQLLRVITKVVGVDSEVARGRLRAYVPDADPQDRLLLDDLLGVADPDAPRPQIDPDARRRRLTALSNTASLARAKPALYIIEDAHWIDTASESMLADFITVIPHVPSMVLITARPEYRGTLAQVHDMKTIMLVPLGNSDIESLLAALMGTDRSVGDLAGVITDRAAGNPFFAEEMVRELVQHGVLDGQQGNYVCRADIADVSVPATVQAAIAARLDRLSAQAKHTLNAASVIGTTFEADLLVAMEINPVFDELLSLELIDQVRFSPSAECAFHHALICAVAYESQLKSGRAEWHRRLAAAIQERRSDALEENAGLIAAHLEGPANLVRHTAGICEPVRGPPTAMSPLPGSAGSGRDTSPTHCPPTDLTAWPCASVRAPCCARRRAGNSK
jgi:predicted ATPase